MKKYILIVIIACISISACYAHIDIDTSKLKKVRDFINNKVTYLMLQEYMSKGTDVKLQKSFNNIKSRLDGINNVESAISFSEMEKDLNAFTKAKKKLSTPLSNINISTFNEQSNEEIAGTMLDTAFSILNKYDPQYSGLKAANMGPLKAAIIGFLNEGNALASSTPDPEGDTTIRTPDPDPSLVEKRVGFFSFSGFSFWTLLPLLLSIAIFIWMMIKTSDLNYRIDKRKGEINAIKEKPSKDFFNTSAIGKRDIENAIINSDTLQKMSQDIEDLKSYKRETKRENDFPSKKGQQTIPKDVAASPGEVFYMAGPVGNYFPLEAKSLTKENTVYKFTVQGNNREALYEIHTLGAPINEILSIAESYIKPACDEENLPGAGVKSIINKQQGIAILEGDRWIIKTKAIIRYE